MADSETHKQVSELTLNSETNLIPERVNWDRPIEFVLSCVGYAVGLGNVWRFPYLCYRNGGGAFLIPYIIMLFTLGLPIFFLELVVGQYTGLGPNQAFERMAPIFQGLGYCTLVVITLVTVYYMVIVAWTIFYIFASFSATLGWGSCHNTFNTDNCYSGVEEDRCAAKDNTTIFYNKQCTSVSSICENNSYVYNNSVTECWNATAEVSVPIRDIITRVLASQEYYNNYVLGVDGASWYEFGYPRWQLVLCLLLGWMIAYLCVVKGVQSAGKAVYFTALFPYVILFILLVRGATLPGAVDGIRYYISPRWELLKEPGVWGDAASQIFYAFGIGCGSLVTLSSYSSFTNNCHRDALIVSSANAFTSVLAGFTIFSVLGFLAQQMGVPVSEVASSGPGLAFIAYPEAVLRMPVPQLWSVLFFFMLFILGLGSQFAGIEAVNTAILDNWPQLRKHRSLVTLGTCVVCFLLAIPMCCNGGVYLFTLMDWNTASWAILLIGLAEVGSVAWVYGCTRFLDDIGDMKIKMNKVIRAYWWITWTVLAPAVLLGVFIFIMYTYTPAKYEDYAFPVWANAMGWMISLSTLVPMPLFALYRIVYKGPKGKALFRPTEEWGPQQHIVRDTPESNTFQENPKYVKTVNEIYITKSKS